MASAYRRKLALYDSFDGGERGRFGAWKSIPGSFEAINMLVYKTGELGVRPGLKNISPSGLANGVVHGFGVDSVANADVWFIQGTAIRTFSQLGANNLQTAATALNATPSAPVNSVANGNDIYFCSATDSKIYKFSPATSGAGTLTVITAPGAKAIAIYGDRMVLADINGSFGYRLRYSDAIDYTSWPAANFIDIGDGFNIGGLYAQRQHLLIGKQNGFWVLTGVPGVNASLRKVMTTNGPVRPEHGSLGWRDSLFYQGLGMAVPSQFNGSLAQILHHLEYNSTTAIDGTATFPPKVGIAPLRARDEGAVYVAGDGSNKALAYINGVWTYHTFGVNVSGYVDTTSEDNVITICDGGGASQNPKFYAWNCTIDQPGIEGGTLQKAGDDSTTQVSGTLTFPEFFDPLAGSTMRVKNVIVDFRKWNTGGASTNHFDLTVKHLRRYDTTPLDATTQSWDEAGASSSASGTLQRKVFAVGDVGETDGFQLAFTNVRGIAFQRIQVELEYPKEPGVG